MGPTQGHPCSRLFLLQLTQERSPPPLEFQSPRYLIAPLFTSLINLATGLQECHCALLAVLGGKQLFVLGAPSLEVTVQQCLGWEGFFDQILPRSPPQNHSG